MGTTSSPKAIHLPATSLHAVLSADLRLRTDRRLRALLCGVKTIILEPAFSLDSEQRTCHRHWPRELRHGLQRPA